MKIWIAEKPAVAADLAKVLGGARRTPSYWETNAGLVTWCFGHLLELEEPEGYDEKYKKWNFDDLPIVPSPFKVSPKKSASAQLKAIGSLLKQCSGVVIATDADREGEMIGREVLDYFNYGGPIERLWLSALDEASIKKAIAQIRSGAETESLYFAALGRARADWLVGMNMTRAMSLKTSREKGVVSVGRVQTPTVAIVVRRDREIEQFKARTYFELVAQVATGSGGVTLRYAPREEERLWEKAAAAARARAAQGQSTVLKRETQLKTQSPPKLFALSGLQKKANALWGWPADKTLKIAQSLYETHKATTYPRTDCEYLPEEQLVDVGTITGILLKLERFSHLRADQMKPRRSVFNTSKVSAHHAIIPTKMPPPMKEMSADEQSAYFLIAAHYLASLLPDYEFLSTKLSATAAGIEFSTTGTLPQKAGWKMAFDKDGGDEQEERSPTLPDIPDGTHGLIEACDVDVKQTKPPARYTEGTLIEDMKSVAKFVTDDAKKARLKETSGIGTEATRAAVIATIKDRDYVETKGKHILSTEKGRALIGLLERELPSLADPGETAVWEEALEAIAEGKAKTNAFVGAVGDRLQEYLGILRNKPDSPSQAPGLATGVMVPAFAVGGTPVELLDHGKFYTADGWPGVFFRARKGREMTASEIGEILKGEKACGPFDGFLSAKEKCFSAKLVLNKTAKPYPKIEMVFDDAPAPAQQTGVRTDFGEIRDAGDYFQLEGLPGVKLWKKVLGRAISEQELASIISAGEKGYPLRDLVSSRGQKYSVPVRLNKEAKPFAKIEPMFS